MHKKFQRIDYLTKTNDKKIKKCRKNMKFLLSFYTSKFNFEKDMPSHTQVIQGTREYAINFAKSIMSSNSNFKYYNVTAE
jgi:hypothetical protein